LNLRLELAAKEEQEELKKESLDRARESLVSLQAMLTQPLPSHSDTAGISNVSKQDEAFQEAVIVLEMELELLCMNWEACEVIVDRQEFSDLSMEFLKYCAGES
jgi:hypothetical protein